MSGSTVVSLSGYLVASAGSPVVLVRQGRNIRPWSVYWKRAKASAGVPDELHFHDLRHAGNHFAAASGASTRELMGRMGHASMRAALIYQHRTVERDRAIADALDAMLRAGE